jgi:hypothetical protein
MLSYIYRIVREYQKTHHCSPNLLYLNKEQFCHLRHAFSDPDNIDEMSRQLAMHIIISHDALHPHLARIEKCWAQPDQLPDFAVRHTAFTQKSLRNNKKGL